MKIIFFIFVLYLLATPSLSCEQDIKILHNQFDAEIYNSKNKNILYEFIGSKFKQQRKDQNLIVIALGIDDCQSCINSKVNGFFDILKAIITDARSVLFVESSIPQDAYSLKENFIADYFFEDTLKLFTSSRLIYPTVLIIDKNKNIFNLNLKVDIENNLNKSLDSLIN